MDHVILGYNSKSDNTLPGIDIVPEDWRQRQQITLQLASDFFKRNKKRKCKFVPVGVAQGWSPASYTESVSSLQKMGYKFIALGGLVPLKTEDILAVLKTVKSIKKSDVQFHLFGITRTEHLSDFEEYGATSFDSTSPFRKAFKDDRDNYYTARRTYTAIRVPQVDKNNKMKNKIRGMNPRICPASTNNLNFFT